MLSSWEDEDIIDPEVQKYIDFLNDDDHDRSGFLTHDRVDENFEKVGKCLNEFIVYPDRFVDLIISTPKWSETQFASIHWKINNCKHLKCW